MGPAGHPRRPAAHQNAHATHGHRGAGAATGHQAAPGHKIYPYLLRKLAINRANQVWALDTTYIPMARGFVYLTAVVDVASRKVLAHKVAITLAAVHAKEVIEQAFARYGTPEIVNTDQQPVHGGGIHRCRARPRLQAVDGRARRLAGQRLCRAPVAQRQIRTGISEGLRRREAARADIADYLGWYNTHRPHSSLERLTPHEKYLAALPQLKRVA